MKIVKKITASILLILILVVSGGYFYFDQKFTPEKNYLTVNNESGKVPIKWSGNNKNALLLPVTFKGDSTIYYLQFDTGAVYTELYSKSIKSLKEIKINENQASTTFYIGKTRINSNQIKVSPAGKEPGKNDSIKIIGTLGADILENRKALINFKENFVVFNIAQEPVEFRNHLIDFSFKKRKIIIHGLLKGKEEKFLYDSGTSAYELLTNKETWERLKLPHSAISIEKAQSRPRILTTYTTKCKAVISFKNEEIPLKEVTYVEGFSSTQYMLMKFSGMTGMLGNKIFLKNVMYIDCAKEKIGIK